MRASAQAFEHGAGFHIIPRFTEDVVAIHHGGIGSEDDLVEVVPYLVSGVFQDFPGANGQVRRLTFEVPRR